MNNYLNLYRDLKISKTDLQQAIGDDLHNVECKKAHCIHCKNVINAIQSLLNGEIDINALVEWVNVIWFTDLYVFVEAEADSIISVLEILETMDEDGVVISESEFKDMMTALASNTEYISK